MPYEYGRVKDDPPAEVTTAAWIEPTNPPPSCPEYLHLAPMFDQQPDFENWLQKQRAKYAACMRPPEDFPGGWDVNRY